ncbi:hypothetical protein KC343_g13065, partial [Hortaea werneckii]
EEFFDFDKNKDNLSKEQLRRLIYEEIMRDYKCFIRSPSKYSKRAATASSSTSETPSSAETLVPTSSPSTERNSDAGNTGMIDVKYDIHDGKQGSRLSRSA